MPSFLKAIAHTVATSVVMLLPVVHVDFLNMTVGTVVALLLNWVISHTIPTTSGASASQG